MLGLYPLASAPLAGLRATAGASGRIPAAPGATIRLTDTAARRTVISDSGSRVGLV